MIPYERRIRSWIRKKGYSLHLQKREPWQVFFDEKKIVGDPGLMTWGENDPVMKINRKQSLAVLLHECGHVKRECEGRARGAPPPKSGDEKPALTWYLTMLHDELDAWEAAEEIARDLNIRIPRQEFTQMKELCLASYVAWCNVRGDISRFVIEQE